MGGIIRHGGEKPNTSHKPNAHGGKCSKAASLAEGEHMKYLVNLYNGNGEHITSTTENACFSFVNGTPHNDIYDTAAALVKATPTAAAFRVYPFDDVLLTLRCAKTAASVAANKGGKAAATEHTSDKPTPTETAAANKAAAFASKQTANARTNATQAAIDSDLRRIAAATLAALCNKAAAFDVAAFVYAHIATANAHTQDYFSVCMLAALETNGTPTEKAAAIYKAANAYTYANKAASVRDVSIEWIIDGGGDVVSFGKAAAAILKGGERWTPTAAASMDTETAAALGVVLAAAFEKLTPTQQAVTLSVVRGYSQRQTAAALGRSVGTIGKHIAIIRRVYSEYITENAPQFAELVRQAETAAAAKATAARDTTAAERMRRYRERKAAAKAAAAANA